MKIDILIFVMVIPNHFEGEVEFFQKYHSLFFKILLRGGNIINCNALEIVPVGNCR